MTIEYNRRTTESPQRASDQRRIVLDGLTGYINAGGRGTRLNGAVAAHPDRGIAKALLQVGKPPLYLINHQINKMDNAGIGLIYAGVGDHQEVANHVEKNFSGQEHVRAVYYDNQLGTGGDLVRTVKDPVHDFSQDIMVANVDTILDVDEAQLLDFHRSNDAALSIVLTTLKGVPNQDAFYVDSNDRVVYSVEAPLEEQLKMRDHLTAYCASSAGSLIVKKELLEDMPWTPEDGPLSLYKDVMKFALGQSAVFGFNNGEALFMDVGTTEKWKLVQSHPEQIQGHLYYGTQ